MLIVSQRSMRACNYFKCESFSLCLVGFVEIVGMVEMVKMVRITEPWTNDLNQKNQSTTIVIIVSELVS